MKQNKNYPRHYEETEVVKATVKEIFDFTDNHSNLSLHMNRPSLMMGGGRVETKLDGGKGQIIGSHIIMEGTVFGIKLFLDEVVVKREPPYLKEWETVGKVKLVVIGDYRLGFRLEDMGNNAKITVYIDYSLPEVNKILGVLFGGVYAKWCVRQMVSAVVKRFS